MDSDNEQKPEESQRSSGGDAKQTASKYLNTGKASAGRVYSDLRNTPLSTWKDRSRSWRWQLGAFLGLALLFGLLFVVDVGGWGKPVAYDALTFTSFLGGLLSGVIISFALFGLWWLWKRFGKIALLLSPFILVIVGDVLGRSIGLNFVTAPIAGLAGIVFGIAIAVWILSLAFPIRFTPKTEHPIVFGSSRWGTTDDLETAGMLGEQAETNGLFLGFEQETGRAIVYDGDMHGLTVAPTRTGKGATAIIPNLMRSRSSMLVIDPKGENARRTVASRLKLEQDVFVVDPWEVSTLADTYGPGVEPIFQSRFNPLAALDPNDPDLATDAMLLADALVIDDAKDPFWSNEAKALIQGFIMHVVTSDDEEEKHLGRVRDILNLPPSTAMPGAPELTIDAVINAMIASDYPVVNQAAFRFHQKAEKERSGVISAAQSNTHFLDSPRIRKNLSHSDFSFSELKTSENGMTVYLVLPLDRLNTFNRWLRLLISSAMIDFARVPSDPDKQPVRVLLDEFAALQKLELIETAYGTMAGMGVQLWAFTQDLGQLMRLYGDKAWQTFVSNAGVFQYFGSRDYETAKYAEHLCGMTTMKKRSFSFGSSRSYTSGSSYSSTTGSSETTSIDDVSRPLAYADEMMTLHRDLQLLFIENLYPVVAKKHYWFRDAETLEGESPEVVKPDPQDREAASV